MASPHTDKSTKRAERLAQARLLANQARQNRTTPWYIPFTITSIGAGASFDAFGHSIGFLYALCLAIAFAGLTWGTVRLIPSLASGEPGSDQPSVPRKILALVRAPASTHGLLVVAAAVPAVVALVKTVGFYALGGALIVIFVIGVALLAAWLLDRR
jgi:hypothetical protein